MSSVYILQSEKTGRYYIGSTKNLNRRLAEHNRGKTRSLLYQRPLKVVFEKKCDNISEARCLEIKLKKYKSRNILEQIIMENDIKSGH